jgi:hypothetical protein
MRGVRAVCRNPIRRRVARTGVRITRRAGVGDAVVLGKWVTTGSAPVVELWLGLCFVAIYAVLALATYPFARRGPVPASLAVVVPAVLILGWIAYGISRF